MAENHKNAFLTERKHFKKILKLTHLNKKKQFIKTLSKITVKDTKKKLLESLSKNPEHIMREYSNKNLSDFNSYIESLENSMNNYQLSNDRNVDEKWNQNNINNRKKYLKKVDTIFIRKICNLNKKYNPDLTVTVKRMKFSDPYQSLSIIRKNHSIFEEVNKNILNRQGDLFKQKIISIQKYKDKHLAKMPRINLSNAGLIPYDTPLVDLTDHKEKKGISDLPRVIKNDEKIEKIRLFAYYQYPYKNFPEGREQFSLFYNNNNRLYLCGGLTVNSTGLNFWCLNLENLEWNKLPQKESLYNRFGHTAVLYQNKIVFFGGRIKTEFGFLFQGLDIFSISDGIYYKPKMGRINAPKLRRNHIAELINEQLLIYGGVTENNEVLNDCYLLNFNPLKWSKANISPNSIGPRVYGHTSSLVIPRQFLLNRKLNIYSYPIIDIVNSKIKQNGLYIFGGKSKEEGGITNKVWILILGQRTLKWMQPETKGKPPRPRYNHSMSFYERGNFLIVHGGRNDNMSETFAFDDTFIFDLENFEWYSVELYSQLPQFKVLTRCGHQSIIYSNKLIILGGMNNNNYLGSSLLIVDLDFSYGNEQNISHEIIRKESKNKKDQDSKKQIINLKNDIKTISLRPSVDINNINLPSLK